MADPIYLVTGANGFVGTCLVSHLCAKGQRVRAMVRDARKAEALRAQGVDVAIGSLDDAASLARACEGVAGVYHIAALFNQAGLPESAFMEVNVEGTRRLLDAAIAAGVRRFVHCSTNGVHGDIKNPPANETAPYAPCDEYQRSKVEGEKLVFEYLRSGKIGGVIIRPAMIYGPGDTRLFKIFRLIERGRFFYVGSGDVWCHFIDVRDLAESFLLAMQHEERNAEAYLIAGKTPVMLKNVADLIADTLQVKRPWLHVPLKPMQWAGDLCEAVCAPFGINPPLYRRRVDFFIKNRCFDISKAQRELQFAPARDFGDELRDIIAWYVREGLLTIH